MLKNFLYQPISLQLPSREQLENINPLLIGPMLNFIKDIIQLRKEYGLCWEAYCDPAKIRIAALKNNKKSIIGHIRAIIGQKHGVPAARLLFLMPIEYIEILEYVLERCGYAVQIILQKSLTYLQI